jgi:hypothetical protein
MKVNINLSKFVILILKLFRNIIISRFKEISEIF